MTKSKAQLMSRYSKLKLTRTYNLKATSKNYAKKLAINCAVCVVLESIRLLKTLNFQLMLSLIANLVMLH